MNNFFSKPKLSLSVLAIAMLQAGCGSSGGSASSGQVSLPLAIVAVTSFSPTSDTTAPLATSSSGLKNHDIVDALTTGGKFSTTSELLQITGKIVHNDQDHTTDVYDTENILTSGSELELQFESDGSFTFDVNGTAYQGSSDDFELYGNYGALVVGDLDDTREGNVTTEKVAAAIIGIKTDNINMPTEGTATYVAKESLNQFSFAYYSGLDANGTSFEYQSEYNDMPGDDNGDFITTLNANFASATIDGSMAGNLTSRGEYSNVNGQPTWEQLDLPTTVLFNETSIANSDFSGSGTASIDDKTIAVNYGGSLYGPNAEEASVIFSGTHSDGAIINGGAYLFQE